MNQEGFVHRHLCSEQSYISAGFCSPLPAQVTFTPLGLFTHFMGESEHLMWGGLAKDGSVPLWPGILQDMGPLQRWAGCSHQRQQITEQQTLW